MNAQGSVGAVSCRRQRNGAPPWQEFRSGVIGALRAMIRLCADASHSTCPGPISMPSPIW